jgi:hypothetical protein
MADGLGANPYELVCIFGGECMIAQTKRHIYFSLLCNVAEKRGVPKNRLKMS